MGYMKWRESAYWVLVDTPAVKDDIRSESENNFESVFRKLGFTIRQVTC